MIIKKFNNGKIKLQLEKSDEFYYNDSSDSYSNAIKGGYNTINIEKLYHDEFFNHDLYIQSIGGYGYIMDTSNNLFYSIYDENGFQELSGYVLNTIKSGLLMSKNNTLYLYPLTKKECKELLKDLENGY